MQNIDIGVCTPPKNDGQSCEEGEECKSGTCVFDEMMQQKACKNIACGPLSCPYCFRQTNTKLKNKQICEAFESCNFDNDGYANNQQPCTQKCVPQNQHCNSGDLMCCGEDNQVKISDPALPCDPADPADCQNQPLYLCVKDPVTNNNKCLEQVHRRKNHMTCQDDDQCVSFNCNTTSSGSQCKCVVNAPASSVCDVQYNKDDCNGIGCFWDEKERVETAKCKTRQSKCALEDFCSTDSDCAPGTKCGDEKKCIAKCNLLNTDGDCNEGDSCKEACAGGLFCRGITDNPGNKRASNGQFYGWNMRAFGLR